MHCQLNLEHFLSMVFGRWDFSSPENKVQGKFTMKKLKLAMIIAMHLIVEVLKNFGQGKPAFVQFFPIPKIILVYFSTTSTTAATEISSSWNKNSKKIRGLVFACIMITGLVPTIFIVLSFAQENSSHVSVTNCRNEHFYSVLARLVKRAASPEL